MDRKNTIRVVCTLAIAICVLLTTCFLSLLFIRTTLGNTSYAVKIPLLIPLCLLALLISTRIFSVSDASQDEYEEIDEGNTEDQNFEVTQSYDSPEFDESAYPELFKNKLKADVEQITRPDIKALLHQQMGEVEIKTEAPTKEDIPEISLEIKKNDPVPSLYSDIPTELPEDYVPYEYNEEEDAPEDDEEYYEITPFHKVIAKVAATLVASILAIILPINFATVYSPDTITVRRPFIAKEYHITDANYYTVGVKLSGDISMKLHFDDGEEKELIFPNSVIQSQGFKNNFSSKYAYAAFCNRLLARSGVEKRFDDLVSLSPSDTLSQKDLAYIEEIAEIDLTP